MKMTITTEWDYEGQPRESVTTTTEAETLPEVLTTIERHLRGAGFYFDGELEIVGPPESPVQSDFHEGALAAAERLLKTSADNAGDVTIPGQPPETVAMRFLAYCRPNGSKTWLPMTLPGFDTWPTACGDSLDAATISAEVNLDEYVAECAKGGNKFTDPRDWEIAIAESSIVKVIRAANG